MRIGGLKQNPRVAASDDLRHACEIVLTFHGLDPIAAIVLIVRETVLEAHHGCDDMGGRDIRNIEALHDQGGGLQMEQLVQLFHIPQGIGRVVLGKATFRAGESTRRT